MYRAWRRMARPPGNMALAAVLSAVAGLRRQAGDLLVIQASGLGHFVEHGNRGELTDAGDPDEDLEAGRFSPTRAAAKGR